MKNLLTRTLTGAAYVGIILVSLLTHPVILALTTTLIAFLALKELGRILSKNNLPEYGFYVMGLLFLVSVMLIYYASKPQVIILPLLLLFIIIQAGAVFLKMEQVRSYLINMSFTLLYIISPLFILNLTHQLSLNKEMPFTLAIFVLIWTNDTFAYLTGMAFGKHKLFERVSPKKTWEGFFGGILMTLAATYIIYMFYPSLGIIKWLVFGFLTSIAAVFGDFIESLLKRSAHVKDSGTLLPGHGGVLDRIDSLLLVIPVLYIYLLLILK